MNPDAEADEKPDQRAEETVPERNPDIRFFKAAIKEANDAGGIMAPIIVAGIIVPGFITSLPAYAGKLWDTPYPWMIMGALAACAVAGFIRRSQGVRGWRSLFTAVICLVPFLVHLAGVHWLGWDGEEDPRGIQIAVGIAMMIGGGVGAAVLKAPMLMLGTIAGLSQATGLGLTKMTFYIGLAAGTTGDDLQTMYVILGIGVASVALGTLLDLCIKGRYGLWWLVWGVFGIALGLEFGGLGNLMVVFIVAIGTLGVLLDNKMLWTLAVPAGTLWFWSKTDQLTSSNDAGVFVSVLIDGVATYFLLRYGWRTAREALIRRPRDAAGTKQGPPATIPPL